MEEWLAARWLSEACSFEGLERAARLIHTAAVAQQPPSGAQGPERVLQGVLTRVSLLPWGRRGVIQRRCGTLAARLKRRGALLRPDKASGFVTMATVVATAARMALKCSDALLDQPVPPSVPPLLNALH